MAVQAIDLWKTYDGSSFVLEGVDLRVEPGEVKVVWGPNGSGKTTLLNILGCLDLPTRGAVLVDHEDAVGCGEAHRAELRRDFIGFVFQTPYLIDDLSVIENIALPLRLARRRGFHSRVEGLLAEIGLTDLAQRKPQELSGGQAKKVAIARALVGSPRAILADEPTAALDQDASEVVLSILSKAARDGAAVVIASNDPLVRQRFQVGLRLEYQSCANAGTDSRRSTAEIY